MWLRWWYVFQAIATHTIPIVMAWDLIQDRVKLPTTEEWMVYLNSIFQCNRPIIVAMARVCACAAVDFYNRFLLQTIPCQICQEKRKERAGGRGGVSDPRNFILHATISTISPGISKSLPLLSFLIKVNWRGPIAEWLARRTVVRFIRGSNPGPSPTQGCLNTLFARHKAFPIILTLSRLIKVNWRDEAP